MKRKYKAKYEILLLISISNPFIKSLLERYFVIIKMGDVILYNNRF